MTNWKFRHYFVATWLVLLVIVGGCMLMFPR